MRNEITIHIRGINWTMGESCIRYVKVPKGVPFAVDWGDGKVEQFVGNEDYVETRHEYSARTRKNELLHITRIYPLDEDAPILGLKDYSCEMKTEEVNLSQCPSLEELYYEGIEKLDVTCCPRLWRLILRQTRIKEIDLSGNPDLRVLSVAMSPLEQLNLTPCSRLRALSCWMCSKLKQIAVSNQSWLEYANLIETEALGEKSLRFIRQAVERNGGQVVTNQEEFWSYEDKFF